MVKHLILKRHFWWVHFPIYSWMSWIFSWSRKKQLLLIVPSKTVKKEQSERHIGHKFIGSNPAMHLCIILFQLPWKLIWQIVWPMQIYVPWKRTRENWIDKTAANVHALDLKKSWRISETYSRIPSTIHG